MKYLAVTLLLLSACFSWALNLAWDASIDSSVIGYILYSGPSSGNYSNPPLTLGNVLTATVANPAVGQTMFFVVTARSATTESLPSNEISYTQPAPKSNNSFLSTIQLGGVAIPNFVQTIGTYDIPVSNATAAIVITAVVTDAKSTVTCKGVLSGSGTWQTGLAVGANLFPIVVIAEDGTSRTYNLTITRALPPPLLPPANLRFVAP